VPVHWCYYLQGTFRLRIKQDDPHDYVALAYSLSSVDNSNNVFLLAIELN
jgi:hypothetical protein